MKARGYGLFAERRLHLAALALAFSADFWSRAAPSLSNSRTPSSPAAAAQQQQQNTSNDGGCDGGSAGRLLPHGSLSWLSPCKRLRIERRISTSRFVCEGFLFLKPRKGRTGSFFRVVPVLAQGESSRFGAFFLWTRLKQPRT